MAKRDSSVPRVVHDLSFPPRQSVNDGIARDEYLSQPFHLRLPGVGRLVEEGILVDVYIDDFYGAETQEQAEHSFDHMTQLFLELGLSSSPDKDTLPTHEMTCLGVCVNTLNMTLTVPDFHLEELQDLLSSWLNKAPFSKRELQQLQQQYPVSDAICGDLVWWKHFLQHYNGVSIPIYSHACLGACGAVCFGEFFHAPFPPFIASQNLNINQLELLTILVSLKLLQDRLRGCTI